MKITNRELITICDRIAKPLAVAPIKYRGAYLAPENPVTKDGKTFYEPVVVVPFDWRNATSGPNPHVTCNFCVMNHDFYGGLDALERVIRLQAEACVEDLKLFVEKHK